MNGARLVSFELERMMMHGDQAAGPTEFRAVLADLTGEGWVPDPDLGPGGDRMIRPVAGLRGDQSWSATCDITTSLFETTVSPVASLWDLDRQHHDLDAVLRPVLDDRHLTLLQTETQPVVAPTRELFARTAATWRQPYRARAERGEDAYWASWIAGSTPCVDVSVREAMRALRLMLRLTPVSLLLSRSGSVTGGRRSPGGRLTVRPWAHHNVFASSPHPADLSRVLLPQPELRGWRDYVSYLMDLPTFVLTGPDGRAHRVPGDPPFRRLAADPQWTIRHFQELQRHVFFTRPRFLFGPDADLAGLLGAHRDGEPALVDYLERHLVRLYLEIRPDSPAPPGEDLCLIALWVGLLDNLDEAEAYVLRRPHAFWLSLMDAAQYAPLATTWRGCRLPDLLAGLVEIAARGLDRRGRHEGRFLDPVTARLDRLSTPAEDIARLLDTSGTSAIVDHYAWRPAPVATYGGV